MMPNLRRTFAAAAASALVLTGAACSKDTEGTASPASATATSKTSEPTTSEAQESETSSQSSSASSSDKPAGSAEASDGSFSFTPPAGFEEALDQVSVPGAIAAVVDPDSDATFPTHIVVTSASSPGTVDAVADQVRAEIESKFSTTTQLNGPDASVLPDIDGEDYTTWTTGDYQDGGQDVASAQIVTKHDGKFYFVTVNALPANKSDAGAALVELAGTIAWS